MAYQATNGGEQEVSGRTDMLIILRDPQGNWPDYCETVTFPMPRVSVTNAMRTTQRRRVMANAIVAAVKERAREKLQRLQDRYYSRVETAIAQLKADMQGDWQQQQVRPADVRQAILDAWSDAGLSAGANGVPPSPTVVIDGTDVSVG